MNIDTGATISPSGGMSDPTPVMPTILEMTNTTPFSSSSLDRRGGVRQIINTIKNAPHRFSQQFESGHRRDEENSNLTQNILD